MLFVSLLGWWYTRGWAWTGNHLFIVRNVRILQFFSVSDLLKTLFAPFRQDSIQVKNAPIGIKLQAFGMNVISRFFGLIIRSVLIIIGLLLVLLNTMLGVVFIVIWPLLPASPVIAAILVALDIGAAHV